MAKDFIEQRIGSASIIEAQRQQRQLLYFTESSVQQEVTQEYFKQWVKRNSTDFDDSFLNWVKSVFKTDNFLSFYKYLRFPIPSAELVQDRIKEPMGRVLFSEDSYFNYIIRGEEEQECDLFDDDFKESLVENLLFHYNDIIVTDLKDVNKPFRQRISIEDVVAIVADKENIFKLAYSASIVQVDEDGIGKVIEGFAYVDTEVYAFYDKEIVLIHVEPHDLERCPADFIAKNSFSSDPIVRKSIFSFVRGSMEEYTFLKTLERMVTPNGAIPVVTMLDTKTKKKDGKNIDGVSDKEPMASNVISSQQSTEFGGPIQDGGSNLETGSEIHIPMMKNPDGSINMDVVTNFINFYHMPVEALNYLHDRVAELEQQIITSVLGDFSEADEAAKNELQVSKSFVSKEDKLRGFSIELSRIRKKADLNFLELENGKDEVVVDLFYGSDFFLESQATLYDLLEKAPNTIERKKLLIRLSKNRNRFNKLDKGRDVILYNLMPYVSDTDFDKAVEKEGAVDSLTFIYQTRFNYWINAFEAANGDILAFFISLGDKEDAEKYAMINNLIFILINNYENTVSSNALVLQGDSTVQ